MRTHITALVSRYRGRITEWDVVNEAIEVDGSYRHNIWYDVIGPDYIELAFRFAHEADPDARLYLNEVDAEVNNERSQGLYALASSLIARGVPIDGVGFQGHVFYAPGHSADAIAANFHRFAELGLDVQVTEADVVDDTIAASNQTERRAIQAEAFRTLADACYREPACVRFTMWGLSDRYSWLGSNRHPLPFDSAMQPKPAWPALEQELRPPAPE
jgi:endo-1,4-beta-xylanase